MKLDPERMAAMMRYNEELKNAGVLTTLDGNCLDPSVDARGYIEARCIGLALYEQRFRSQQIKDG